MPSLSRRQLLAASGVAALGLAGCAADQKPAAGTGGTANVPDAAATTSAAATTEAGATTPPARNSPRLLLTQSKAEATTSLESIEKLDDHPLWSMTWKGGAAQIDENPPTAGGDLSAPGFACTLWVATGTDGRPIVGRNWDWDHGPGLVLHSETPAARTLSLTDMTFLGLTDDDPLDELSTQQQGHLLRAQAGLVEGVNEHGVFIGLAADKQAVPTEDEGHFLVGGLSVQRLVLDQARDVADAEEIFRSVDLDFTGGPGLHYLVADRHGGAAAIECDQGTLYVESRPEDQPWLCLENFHVASVQGKQRERHRRWSTCAKTLHDAGGVMDTKAALGLLDEVRQGITQWSSVCDLAAGTVEVRTSAGQHSLSL